MEEGSDLLDREKIPAAQRSFSASVDARYERQNYESGFFDLSDRRQPEVDQLHMECLVAVPKIFLVRRMELPDCLPENLLSDRRHVNYKGGEEQ